MSLSPEERMTLTIVGALALAGLLVVLWQRQGPPLVVEAAPAQAAAWNAALAHARRVDINAASAADLERLPEVGPGLAKRIVEYRAAHGPFAAPEALSRVKGIGPKKLKALAPYTTVK